jgi:hypothetical protein
MLLGGGCSWLDVLCAFVKVCEVVGFKLNLSSTSGFQLKRFIGRLACSVDKRPCR